MKKTNKMIVVLMTLFINLLVGQDGNTCANSISIASPTNLTTIALPAGITKWISCSTSGYSIRFEKVNNPNLKIIKATSYTNNCASLIKLRTDSNPNPDSSYTWRVNSASTYIKIECIGINTNSIQLQVFPNNTLTGTCGDGCELINNGSFDILDPCIYNCFNTPAYMCTAVPCATATGHPFGPANMVPGWYAFSITPQILFNGTNGYAYMWTCRNNLNIGNVYTTISEIVVNQLCTPVVKFGSYKLKMDYAYELYPNSTCNPFSGPQVDSLIVEFSKYSTGAKQRIIIAANINSTAWTSFNQTITLNDDYDLLSIYPENLVSQSVAAIKIDNVSLKPAAISICCNQDISIPAATLSTPSTNLSALIPAPASGIISNLLFDIGNGATLNIDYPIIFDNCKFRMGKESSISLTTTALNKTATFRNQCRFYTCGAYMWNHIIAENSGYTLNMSNSFVEDGYKAIDLPPGCTTNLSFNTFNKNYISVVAPRGTSTVVNSYIPYTFKSNIFSCTASTYSPTNVLKLVKPLGSAAYISPVRSYIGIFAITNQLSSILKVGSTAFAADVNAFTNLDYGIYLQNTRAEIYNNTFNLLPRKQLPQKIFFGTAIYGVTADALQLPVYGYNSVIGGTATNQKNTFTSCHEGIEMNAGYDALTIKGNIFNGSTTNIANYGIVLSNDNMKSLNCTNNNFSFQYNAFTHNFNSYPQFATTNVISTNFCSFSNNTIQNNGLDNLGVYIANLGATNTAANGLYTIENNTIYGSAPISILDLANAAQIRNCTLTVRTNASTAINNFGINVTNCNKAFIEKNVIASDAPTIAACTNENIFGIKVTNSQSVQVKCNTLSKLGTCVGFEGNCQSPNTGLYGNNINSGKYGLRFMNNAIIGVQNASATAAESSHNLWGTPASFSVVPGGKQTISENLSAASNVNVASKLYLNSLPTLNGVGINPGSFPYTNGTGLFSALFNTDYCCVGPGCIFGPAPLAAPSPSTSNMATAIQPATTNTGITDNNVKTINKLAAYNLMTDMPALQSNTAINTFYTSNTTTCIGKMRQVQDQIRLGNFASAKTINNSFVPSCNAETHTKNYFDLYMKWKTDTLCCDSIFKNNVLVIANACPETHGIVVNKAQALYNLITKQNNVFTSNCGTASGSRILNTNNNTTIEEEKVNAKTILENNNSVVPNPNNGQFIIQFANTNNDKVNVIIRDASQKIVFDNKLDVKEGQIKLDLAYLKSGVYFAYINDNTGTQKVLKFIVANNE
jgi:hypothetical protein